MTTQRPDYLRHEGADYRIKPFPLEELGPNWSSVDQGRGDGFSISRFGLLSTACWRGYVASWEIVNDKLYLVSFDTAGCRSTTTPCHKCRWQNTFSGLFSFAPVLGASTKKPPEGGCLFFCWQRTGFKRQTF